MVGSPQSPSILEACNKSENSHLKIFKLLNTVHGILSDQKLSFGKLRWYWCRKRIYNARKDQFHTVEEFTKEYKKQHNR